MAGGSAAPSYMVPSDAPRQGVWYDGNPFEKKGGGARGVAEGDESGTHLRQRCLDGMHRRQPICNGDQSEWREPRSHHLRGYEWDA